jgi:hypothetical protein
MKNLFIVIAAVLLLGCGTLWNHVITLTEVRDSAMKELAALSAKGQISPETDARIAKADLVYRQAAEVAQKALIAYKASGNASDYTAALQAARLAVSGVIDILTPLIAPDKSAIFRANLVKANQL